MKHSLKSVFKQKKDILSIYFTAGYPKLDDTTRIIKYLEAYGADFIEVGIPYSDPLADGETIQKSSSVALKNGINLDIVFDQLNSIKGQTNIPLILMGYLNQLFVYGLEKFLMKCKEAGIAALIIPDMPIDEYESQYKAIFEKHQLSNIFLVTPQTSEERIQKIDRLSDNFIYLVSSSSTTGVKNKISDEQINYFKRIKAMNLHNPCLIGFGISDNKTFNLSCKYSFGGIIGSAFIKAISNPGDLKINIMEFVKSIKSES